MRLPFLIGLLSCAFTSAAATEADRPQHCLNHAGLLTSQIACSRSQTEDLISPINLISRPILIESQPPDPNPFHPWSHEPLCTPFLETIHSPLCVYTNTSFAQGRGISIFTTPQIALEVASLAPFQASPPPPPSPPPHSEDGATSNVNISINTLTNTWSTHPIPSKGLGMLASRDLKRGDLITAYTPVFIAFPEQVLSTAQREHFWRRAVDQLPVRSREMYLGLARTFGDERFAAQDVVKANTFEVQVGGVMHLAVWPETARMNHDCGPNAQYRIDHSALTHFVHAARPISKGDEITIAYINPFLPHTERQETLHRDFHFTCTCARCTSGAQSDAALAQITELQTLLGDWSGAVAGSDSGQARASPRKSEELIALYRAQGLDGFLDAPYGHATLACSAAGDVEGVKRYARLAEEAVGLKDGVGMGDWRLWRAMGTEPRGHWSWRRRV